MTLLQQTDQVSIYCRAYHTATTDKSVQTDGRKNEETSLGKFKLRNISN